MLVRSVINLLYFSILLQQKRYSLQAGPSKRDPRSKSVNPSAVQALLKKQSHATKKKGNEPGIGYIKYNLPNSFTSVFSHVFQKSN